LVYIASEKSGYGFQFFSPHSFRSGQVCDMLCRATDKNMFNSAYNSAKILGNWAQGSKTFNSYIKKSMTGSLIASRFIYPDKEERLTDSDLQNPLKFHNLKSITPKWQANGEFQYKALLKLMFERLVQKSDVEICVESKRKWNKEFHNRYPYSSCNIIARYCKTFYPKEYFIYYDEIAKIDDQKMVARIKPELIIPLLENSTVQSVFSKFTDINDNVYNMPNDFTIEEDLILMQNLKDKSFHLIIMKRPIVCLVKRYKELKNEYNNASYTEILQHIISKNQLVDQDAENTDFT
jgi:hypothetical protein